MLFDAVGGCDQQNSMEALSLADLEAGWSPRPSMEVRRHLPGVGVLDGLIYVVGGADSQWSAQRTVECFHPGMCTRVVQKAKIRQIFRFRTFSES